MINKRDDFAILILTHGRPDKVITIDALKKYGYTGPWYIVIDNEDKTADEYYRRFGDKVIMFDKPAIAKTFDQADNFDNRKAIVYARNASFYIAKHLGLKYFMQMDDDYNDFTYTENNQFEYVRHKIKNLDNVIYPMVDFFAETPRLHTFCMAQGGDFIGGAESSMFKAKVRRKAMNSFICSVDRPFQFLGRINEDVNVYSYKTSVGYMFLTTSLIRLEQKQTQTTSGGMTDIYNDNGTYVKTFYSIMMHPSGVTLRMMGQNRLRMHHHVDWKYVAPKILREHWRKHDAEPPKFETDEMLIDNFIIERDQLDTVLEESVEFKNDVITELAERLYEVDCAYCDLDYHPHAYNSVEDCLDTVKKCVRAKKSKELQ